MRRVADPTLINDEKVSCVEVYFQSQCFASLPEARGLIEMPLFISNEVLDQIHLPLSKMIETGTC